MSPTEVRRRLRSAGISPLPLNGKKPLFDAWQADLVVEGVEAVVGFSLRFRVQRRLQFLNAIRS
jgi:hypothetical protein